VYAQDESYKGRKRMDDGFECAFVHCEQPPLNTDASGIQRGSTFISVLIFFKNDERVEVYS
jgi:hypothetical protein